MMPTLDLKLLLLAEINSIQVYNACNITFIIIINLLDLLPMEKNCLFSVKFCQVIPIQSTV